MPKAQRIMINANEEASDLNLKDGRLAGRATNRLFIWIIPFCRGN
jgi:hypothetical protein